MSQPAESAASPRGTSASFVWTRLGSLLAILPLGVWTVNHLWNNLSAFSGKGAWEMAVEDHPNPVAHWVTMVVVLLPLLLHAAWGLGRLRASSANVSRYATYGNLKYVLQRVTAVGALFFIGAHLWLAMIHPRLVEGRPEPFEDISREMHTAPTLLVYLLGTLGVAFHLGNGLTSFAWTWGLASGRKSLARVDRVAVAAFLVLLAFAWGTIYALYDAGGAYGP